MDHRTSGRGTHQENGIASLSCHHLEWNFRELMNLSSCPVETLATPRHRWSIFCQGEEISGVLTVAYPQKWGRQASNHCYSESHTMNTATIIWTA